jgi:hypothetical protein
MHGNDHKCIKINRTPLRGPQTIGLRRESSIAVLPWEIPGYYPWIPRTVPHGVKWSKCEAYFSFPFGAQV